MPRMLLIVSIFLASTALASSARAGAEGEACASRARVVEKLAERFGETLAGLGLHRDDGVLEVYRSRATGTWTIVMTRPDGLSCLVAAGQRWEEVAPKRTRGSDV